MRETFPACGLRNANKPLASSFSSAGPAGGKRDIPPFTAQLRFSESNNTLILYSLRTTPVAPGTRFASLRDHNDNRLVFPSLGMNRDPKTAPRTRSRSFQRARTIWDYPQMGVILFSQKKTKLLKISVTASRSSRCRERPGRMISRGSIVS
jgi:hypothetical protein